jgi:N-acetylglutamate synthase/N-acetylornithine aminotransferase
MYRLPQPELYTVLKKVVNKIFYLLVEDESIKDIVMIFANDHSGSIDDNFQKRLEYLICQQLARMMVCAEESVTKLIEVEGAFIQ